MLLRHVSDPPRGGRLALGTPILKDLAIAVLQEFTF